MITLLFPILTLKATLQLKTTKSAQYINSYFLVVAVCDKRMEVKR